MTKDSPTVCVSEGLALQLLFLRQSLVDQQSSHRRCASLLNEPLPERPIPQVREVVQVLVRRGDAYRLENRFLVLPTVCLRDVTDGLVTADDHEELLET